MSKFNKEVVQHFTIRANTYNEGNRWVKNVSVLDSITSFVPSQFTKLVDLGAGTCVVSEYILKNHIGDCCAFAVDINEKMLDESSNSNITHIVSKIEEMPFDDGFFDVAVSRQCLHYIIDIKKALREIYRILNLEGVFILAQIVPFDSESKDYWANILKVRQPLRQQYLDETMWINIFRENKFRLESKKHVISRSSLNDWINTYNIQNKDRIQYMSSLFANAPAQYREKYDIVCTDGDIFYNTNWLIAKFIPEH